MAVPPKNSHNLLAGFRKLKLKDTPDRYSAKAIEQMKHAKNNQILFPVYDVSNKNAGRPI
jgi:hypothetical protein